VACESTGGAVTFTGTHKDGDLLIVSEFTNGGEVSTIQVYRWNIPNPAVDPIGALGTTAVFEGVDCRNTAAGDKACATANVVQITTPWLTAAKTLTPEVGHTLPVGQFFEGGLNLTQLNLGGRCFNTFITNTRSSQELTATLFDFATGVIGGCETDLTTTASLNASGTDIISGNVAGSGTASSGTDTAVLTVTGVQTWGGTLNFYLCGPLGSVNDVCSASGVLVTSRTVTQASPASDFISGSATLTSVGRYCWFTRFTPDAQSAAAGVPSAEHAGTPGEGNLECFTVRGAVPTLDTLAVNPTVIFGSPVQDTATLSGLAREPGNNGGNAIYPTINATNGAFGGTIQFTLVGPNSCTTIAAGIGTNPQTLPVDANAGNATYGPVSFTPTTPGTYSWQAVYQNLGAVNNPGTVSHNLACTDTDENVIVQQIQTAISTAPSGFPQDSATISSSSGNLPTGGSVLFKLFSTLAACQSDTGAVYTELKPNVADGTTNQVSGITTTNTTFRIDSTNQGTYYWMVTYAPGSTTHTGRKSDCVENTTMTHINDAGPGTVVPNP
jgi:hypothetical protein